MGTEVTFSIRPNGEFLVATLHGTGERYCGQNKCRRVPQRGVRVTSKIIHSRFAPE